MKSIFKRTVAATLIATSLLTTLSSCNAFKSPYEIVNDGLNKEMDDKDNCFVYHGAYEKDGEYYIAFFMYDKNSEHQNLYNVVEYKVDYEDIDFLYDSEDTRYVYYPFEDENLEKLKGIIDKYEPYIIEPVVPYNKNTFNNVVEEYFK